MSRIWLPRFLVVAGSIGSVAPAVGQASVLDSAQAAFIEARTLHQQGSRAAHRQAIAAFHRSADLDRRHGSSSGVAQVYHNIAAIYSASFGRSDSAAWYYGRALDLWRDLGQWQQIGPTISNAIGTFIALGQLDSAEMLAWEGIVMGRRNGSPALEGVGRAGVGAILVESAKWDSARVYLGQAITAFSGDPFPAVEAKVFDDLAVVYNAMGHPDSSLSVLRIAFGRYTALGNTEAAERIRINIQTLERDMRRR